MPCTTPGPFGSAPVLEGGIRYLPRRDVERLGVSAREIADRLEMLLVAEPRRTDRTARIAFVFGGVGLGDLAAASICLQRARERGVGVMLER